MVLDSTMLGAGLVHTARENLRRLSWDGADPATAHAAARIRALVAAEEVPTAQVGPVVQLVHEFAGVDTLVRFVDAVRTGHAVRTWELLVRLFFAQRANLPPLAAYERHAPVCKIDRRYPAVAGRSIGLRPQESRPEMSYFSEPWYRRDVGSSTAAGVWHRA